MNLKKQIKEGSLSLKRLYLWKRIRDSKIRTKLYVFLFFTILFTGCVIGSVSYVSMRTSLIENAEDSVISFLKYAGSQLDENMQEFQTSVYSFASDREIRKLSESSRIENRWEHTIAEQTMADRLYQYGDLYRNADFVILESEEELFLYNSAESREKISREYADDILKEFRARVSIASPAAWGKSGDRNCFILEITQMENNRQAESLGRIVIGIRDSFFDIGDDSNPYFRNANIVITDQNNEVYKDQELGLESFGATEFTSYKDGHYYVYSRLAKSIGGGCLVSVLRTVKFHMNLLCIVPEELVLDRANAVVATVAFVSVILLAVGLVLAGVFYGMIRKNLDLIEAGMKSYEAGDYSRLRSPACYDELGMLILQFNHMGMEINRLNKVARQEEKEKQNLQYQVLETQINPHFLYNTLGTLKWMAYEKDETEIARLAGALINLLRFTVKNVNKVITLEEEIAYIRDYITIQKTRYENAFDVEYKITAEAAAFPIICFILQPFVENSILHGLDIARGDGKICICGEVTEGRLSLSVEDNGAGMPEEKKKELEDKIEHNKLEEYKGFNGLGVTNIILRLKAVYGNELEYEIRSAEGRGTRITLIIPGKVDNR